MAATTQVLAGRVALVTGGGSGIGKAVCLTFARAGAEVVVADINEKAGKATLDELPAGKHVFQVIDVANSMSVEAAFQAAKKAFPESLDIVVNCAGVLTKSLMEEVTAEDIDYVFGINVKGSFLVTREAARHMGRNGRKGSIIHLASTSSHMPIPRVGVYSASKAAVVMITKTAALELAPRGIRCNAIAPGPIDTPMLTSLRSGNPSLISIEKVPLNRFGQPEDVAKLALFLASDDSSYMTGSVVQLSGGVAM